MRALLIALLLVTTPFPAAAETEIQDTLRIRGSDTMLLLVRNWAEGFMASRPGVVVEVEGGGTAKGIEALIRGDADLASASRPLQPDEARRLAERYGSLGFSVLTARDALSVYVHPSNPVEDLSLDQVAAVFAGDTGRWEDVGGREGRIRVLNRNPASGTHLFFQEHVLGGREYAAAAKVLPTTRAIVEAVRRDAAAIGYGGIGWADGVKSCAVDGVRPTEATVRDGSYPISRYLYLYTVDPPEGLVKELVDWVLGPAGQAIVEEVGYLPLYEPGGE